MTQVYEKSSKDRKATGNCFSPFFVCVRIGVSVANFALSLQLFDVPASLYFIPPLPSLPRHSPALLEDGWSEVPGPDPLCKIFILPDSIAIFLGNCSLNQFGHTLRGVGSTLRPGSPKGWKRSRRPGQAGIKALCILSSDICHLSSVI